MVQLEVFYEQHKDELIAVLTGYSRDREAASDAVAESFLRALKNRSLLSGMPEKSLWSWLYATAKNVLIDEKRKTARYEMTEDWEETGFEEFGSYEADPTDAILVRELLHKLPPRLLQVVALRYFGGMNSLEIGAMKGLPPATVRAQLCAALSLLRKYAALGDENQTKRKGL